MLRISIVVGNPKPKSRTGAIAEMLVARLFPAASRDQRLIDLADHAADLFAWPSDAMAELNKSVAESDLVVFASPTYKASYTGLIKAFLDRYPANGLKNVVAIALMTGAGPGHAMAPTVNLVPLLMELGAVVPVRGLYFNMEKIEEAESVVDAFASEIDGSLGALRPLLNAGPERVNPATTRTGI